MYMNGCSSDSSLNLEIVYMSINRKMIQWSVLYLHKGMLDRESQGTMVILLNITDESEKYNVDKKNSNVEVYMW